METQLGQESQESCLIFSNVSSKNNIKTNVSVVK